MAGFQETQELEMGELWALKPALLFALLERLATDPETRADLIDSLRRWANRTGRDSFEAMSVVDRMLARDPAGAYSAHGLREPGPLPQCHQRTRGSSDAYRKRGGGSARSSSPRMRPSRQVPGPRRSGVPTSVSTWWIAASRRSQAKVATARRCRARIRDYILRNPTYVYLLGIEIVTMIIVYSMLSGLERLTPVFAGFFLLILPATQAAVDFMNNLATSLTRPRALPEARSFARASRRTARPWWPFPPSC